MTYSDKALSRLFILTVIAGMGALMWGARTEQALDTCMRTHSPSVCLHTLRP